MQPPPPPPPPVDYVINNNRANTRFSLNTSNNNNNNNYNYTHIPILNASGAHINAATASSTSSNSSINGATLSQAFENTSSLDLSQSGALTKLPKHMTTTINKPVYIGETNFVNNANSFDLTSLIGKENHLLQQGLNDIETIKQWFMNQLKENRSKQANIQKLKHQNLFSIDKMLIDLKHLNDLNATFKEFLTNNNKEKDDGLSKQSKQTGFVNYKENQQATQQQQQPLPLPTYKDYVEQFDLNKTDLEMDVYLKEKQERIDNLQKEKSLLIRRLFEMKSESADLNRNIVQLQCTNGLNQMNAAQSGKGMPYSTSKPPPPVVQSMVPNTNSKFNSSSLVMQHKSSPSTICNFIELNAQLSGNSSASAFRGSEASRQAPLVNHYYQPQQHFMPINSRSPL